MEDKKMKKILSNIFMTAVLLVAGSVVVSCEKENQPVEGTFTMTVDATKADNGGSKQLTLDGSGLHATWVEGEKVTVYNITQNADLTGYLEAQSDGVSTKLKGELSGTIAKGDSLLLKFLSPSYGSQDGTLAYIAANCDYAEARVKVASISDGTTKNITTTAAAGFVNKQAIVKFTLKNGSNEAISVTPLKVSDGTHTYTVTPASATNVLYVAIPGFSGKTVSLTATGGGNNYDYEKSGITLTSGQYYEIIVKMKQRITYTAPTLRTGLTFNGNQSNPSGSPQALANAGSYTVHYKVVPDAGYSGGIGSTSLGSATMAKANGWCTISPNSSTGWKKSRAMLVEITVSHHGGTLTYTPLLLTNGNDIIIDVSSDDVTITKHTGTKTSGTIIFTSIATTNYNAASDTFTCYD